ncbi:MAG: prenyltransferase/squalene oxidase repeat-containing protein, partial [Planctomycetota bacterium]|nr:prenyltransferase/squalene oxidase repeat-containing protein [Planctomycetota bacterium]
KARNADGGWGFAPGQSHPALTAMALKALLQHPQYDNESKVVSDGFKCLLKFRKVDGGFYIPKEGNANYVTSVAVMAFAAAKNPAHKTVLADAVKFLRGQQIVPGSKTPTGQDVGEKHPYAGGVSYGKHGRPDLSNVGMWMDALHEAGVPADDPAMRRALAFVARLQNRTEGTEGQAFVVRGADDGGFIYAVSQKDGKFVGESKAGANRRGLRSYGSMTYTGFKSMLYADVARNDPRVRAAYGWIRKYWRLDSNPNMPEAQSKQGLFYYYHVFAKALRAWGQDEIPDVRGVKHNWREELIDVLAVRQKKDGSWVNKDEQRWYEGNPVLATCYAVLALQETLK